MCWTALLFSKLSDDAYTDGPSEELVSTVTDELLRPSQFCDFESQRGAIEPCAQVLTGHDRGSNTAIPYVLRRLILVLLEPQLDVAPDCDRVEGKGPGMICSPCAVGVLKTNRCVSDDLWRRESEQRTGAYLLGFLSVNVEVQSTQLVELRPPPSAPVKPGR